MNCWTRTTLQLHRIPLISDHEWRLLKDMRSILSFIPSTLRSLTSTFCANSRAFCILILPLYLLTLSSALLAAEICQDQELLKVEKILEVQKRHEKWIESADFEKLRGDLPTNQNQANAVEDMRESADRAVISCKIIFNAQSLTDVTIDLRGAILRDVEVSETNLSFVDFSHAELTNVSFDGVMLESANFGNSFLKNLRINEGTESYPGAGTPPSSLSAADFSSAKIDGLVITGTDLDGAVFSGAHVKKAKFRGKIGTANFSRSHFEDADFSSAELKGTQFDQMVLIRPLFVETSIEDVSFKNAQFEDVNFTGARFQSFDGENARFFRPQGIGAIDPTSQTHALTQLKKVLKESDENAAALAANGLIERKRYEGLSGFGRLWTGIVRGHWVTDFQSNQFLPAYLLGLTCLVFVFVYTGAALTSDGVRGLRLSWESFHNDSRKYSRRLSRFALKTRIGVSFIYAISATLRVPIAKFDILSLMQLAAQRRPFRMEAIGWIRVIGGLQTALSIYLLTFAVYMFIV